MYLKFDKLLVKMLIAIAETKQVLMSYNLQHLLKLTIYEHIDSLIYLTYQYNRGNEHTKSQILLVIS